MKDQGVLLNILCALAVMWAACAQGELLTNGGFETAGSTADQPAYWEYGYPDTQGSNWGSFARVNWRTYPSDSGRYCGALRGTWAGTGADGGLWQETAATPGTNYRFTAWIYADNGWGPTSQTMFIQFRDDASNLLAEKSLPMRDLDAFWQRNIMDAAAPTNTARVRVGLNVFGAGASGGMSIDALSLTHTPAINDSWTTLPARTNDTPGYTYHPSPTDWRNISMYQIVTDRFNDGDPSNNTNHPGSLVNSHDPVAIHGGDFRGIEEKLDYIRMLGANAIWIAPVQKNVDGEYHGYAIEDFNAIDAHWGTLEDLRSMVDAAHSNGMYVILDVVVNHMGPLIDSGDADFPLFDANGYTLRWQTNTHTHAAPFDRLDRFHNFGEISGSGWENNPQMLYGDFFILDALKTEDPQVRADLIRSYQGLIAATDCDGFRMDTAKHVEMDFWREFLPAMENYAASLGKTNFLITAECNYTDEERSSSFTATNLFNSVLYHPMFAAMQSVFIDGGATAQLSNRLDQLHHYDERARYQLVNFLDNHDEGRILWDGRLNGNTYALRTALTYLYTSLQIPCLYYGTEQAFNGSRDVYARENMFDGDFEWGPSEGDNFDSTGWLYRYIRSLHLIREAYPPLRTGDMQVRWTDTTGRGLFAYTRGTGTGEVLVVLNTDSQTLSTEDNGRGAETGFTNGTVLVDLLDTNTTFVVGQGVQTGQVAVSVSWYGQRLLVPQQAVRPLRPTLSFVFPANATKGVPRDSPIVLFFDQAMVSSTVSSAFHITPSVNGHFAWPAEQYAVFYPSQPMASNTLYTVRVDAAATAGNGRTLGAGFTFSFDTTPTLSFPQNEYQASETNTHVGITLYREYAEEAISVDVQTIAGSAMPGQDFIMTNVTAQFPAGQSNATVYIELINDDLTEVPETFSLLLTNPVGVYIVEPSTATVVLQSEDGMILHEPMDQNPGWTTEAQWSYGQPQGAMGGSHGKPNPAFAHTGTNIYSYNLWGGYSNRINTVYYLTTPAIDCSVYQNVTLSFHRWLGVERSYWDHASIEVSSEGSSWTVIWSNDVFKTIDDTAWTNVIYDLSTWADLQSNVRIRWGLGTTDSSWTYAGWNIDDVMVFGEQTGTNGMFFMESETVVHAENQTNCAIKVYRSGGQAPASIDIRTGPGTAEAGIDYHPTNTTLLFSGSETSRTFYITITDDSLRESAEQFAVFLTNPSPQTTLVMPTGSVIRLLSDEPPLITAGGISVLHDPPGQNQTGESLEFTGTHLAGRAALQGGFGSLGQLYMAMDQTNLYVGGDQMNVGGTEQAAVIFLALPTLNYDASNLWAQTGNPAGLDLLHNIRISPPPDIAVLLGDEYGDGHYDDFNMHLTGGYNMGQGVYYLGATSFIQLTESTLAQYDGTGTQMTASTDDDGNRFTDRWEARIPLTALNISSLDQLTQLHVAGILISETVQGSYRYISGNYMGESAWSSNGLDINRNFGFSSVSITGQPVEIPVSITGTAGEHGRISPSGWHLVARGAHAAFGLLPDAYYHTADIFTNATRLTGDWNNVSSYTWSNIAVCATLHVSFAENVTDNTGTPEWWLAQHGLTNNYEAEAVSDADADGLATWEEFISLTDPTNAASFFSITGLQHTTRTDLSFPGHTSRTYRLQSSPRAHAEWQDISLITVTSDGPVSITLPQTSALFRIRVSNQ